MSLYRRSMTVALITLAAAAVLPAQISSSSASPADEPTAPAVTRPTPSMAVGVLVKTTTSTASAGLVRAAESALPDGVDVERMHKSAMGSRTSSIPTSRRMTGAEAERVAAELRLRSDVVWAAPNYVMTASYDPPSSVRPNDPYYQSDKTRAVWDKRTHNDTRVRQVLGYPNSFRNPGGFSSKAPYLWRATEGEGEVVAVLDTGITVQPDLPGWNGTVASGRILPGYDFVSRYPFDDGTFENTGRDGDGWDANPQDNGDWVNAGECYQGSPKEHNSWHGSHVTGILAAEKNNKLGIVGVAPKVKVLPVRVLGMCGGTVEDIATGIRWAAGLPVGPSAEGVETPTNSNPADVINLSLGGYAQDRFGDFHPCDSQNVPAYVDAIAEARAAGTVVVAAAGNEGWNLSTRPSIPATCPGVIAVGATSEYGDRAGYPNLNGRKSVYSNYGSAVDISAPGGDYYWDGRGIWSTVNTGKTSLGTPTYADYIGTSMATPVVSGGAALIKSLGSFNPAQTEAMLKTAVQRFPKGASSQFKACSTSLCGDGIISLDKVPVPLGTVRIDGDLAVNEPLTAVPGTWIGQHGAFTYQWLRDGVAIAGATKVNYTVTASDIGQRLSVRVGPGVAVFAALNKTSPETPVVAEGPLVHLTELPTTITYGASTAVAKVTVEGMGAGQIVNLRRGLTTLATGYTDDQGVATIPVPGTKWVAGINPIRAIFIGNDGVVASSATLPTEVAVAKASSTVTTSLPTSVRSNARAKITITVRVAGVRSPTGTLKIYDGSRRIVTGTLGASALGRRTIELPKLPKGRHYIKVVYGGNSNILGKASRVRAIKSY